MGERGEETRQIILRRAVNLAATLGLDGLSIGTLAAALEMSKSGLYAHFGSKEALQVATLDEAAAQFTDEVLRPALKAARGEPRVRALFEAWLQWYEGKRAETGCLLVAAAAELDDQPGPPRQRLVEQQQDLWEFLASVTRVAMGEGHFREDLDAEQFAFELYGLLLAYHLKARLLDAPDASDRARAGLERLIRDARPPMS